MLKKHPETPHPLAISLKANDTTTETGVYHRELVDINQKDLFLEYMVPVLKEHHINPRNLEKQISIIKTLNNPNIPLSVSQYPKKLKTQKCNFAEIFLAEYLESTTDTQLPVYRLRYNPNVEQSMKGDDVLLFDLDSNPARIIVGEAKFRNTPTKQAVADIINTLIRSNIEGLPISLSFIYGTLFEKGNDELAEKILNLETLFITGKINIDYVGLLMSNTNARKYVNKYTTNELHNLLMISLNMINPELIVDQAFIKLGVKHEHS
jgi:hypothetical protein